MANATRMPDEDRISAIAREVEGYLAARPDAADSVDGILRWWLTKVRMEESAADLQRALDLLVHDGVVERREIPDGRIVYGRARDRDTRSRPRDPQP